MSELTLAAQYGLTRSTVRKWKKRKDLNDRSHHPHTLHITLTSPQEAIVIELRCTLLLPLDNLPVITRQFINTAVSRSAPDRCLRRHSVRNLKALLADTDVLKPTQTFKDYVPGFVQIIVKYCRRCPTRRSAGISS